MVCSVSWEERREMMRYWDSGMREKAEAELREARRARRMAEAWEGKGEK